MHSFAGADSELMNPFLLVLLNRGTRCMCIFDCIYHSTHLSACILVNEMTLGLGIVQRTKKYKLKVCYDIHLLIHIEQRAVMSHVQVAKSHKSKKP